jgi:hypothetical protein
MSAERLVDRCLFPRPRHRAAASFPVVSRQCVPGRSDEKGGPMYIGLGTLVFIAVVLLIIYLVRRA